ncbi:unnamed protein product [Acanthoscelides obtectus]|nr:unnamed protein product [Acanthoscelides obtectus]CAK1631514.1 Bardet-Biedl syndrome 1 protein homolog [Acanthoscelides obtectus]
MTTLKKSTNDRYDVCCPVLATESGNIFILDPVNFSVLYQANVNRIKSTPFLIAGLGIFNVQYRMMIACREKHVSLLRKDWLEGKTVIQTMNAISDLIITPDDGLIVIGTIDKILHCYTKKGHKLWAIKMAHLVTCLCLIPIRHLSITLTAVGLKNGTIQIYHGRKCVDQTSVPGSPSVIRFGQLGQEENALITVTTEGTVIFRILKRTAEFQLNTTENLPLYQSKPLPLPKRSALFLEQSMREQQTALDMHQSFQQDLIKFRLDAARELIKTEFAGSNTANLKEKIKISAQVLGMGPKFEVIFNLDNMEESKPIYGLKMVLHVNPKYYQCSSNLISIPLIPPGSSHKVKVYVEDKMVDPENNLNIPSVVRVFIIRETTSEPVLAALINMPPMEATLADPGKA